MCVCVCVCVYALAGLQLRSTGSSMDQVFAEEDEELLRMQGGGGGGGGRGRLGVEPVLATSYSANDVSHLEEEELDGSLTRKKTAAPRSVLSISPLERCPPPPLPPPLLLTV